MAAERRDKEINGKTYALLVPAVKPAFKLANRTAVVLAPLLGGFGANAASGGFEIFSMLLRGVDSEAVDEIFLRAVEISKLSCGKYTLSAIDQFEQHFSENRKDLYQACAWALWEIVSPFLPELDAIVSKMKTITNLASRFRTDGMTTIGSEDRSGPDTADGAN